MAAPDVKLGVRAMDSAGTIRTETLPGHLSGLRRHFEISLYFLLLTGVLTLVSTGKLDLVSIFLLPAALLFKGFRWWRGRGPEISNRVATWIAFWREARRIPDYTQLYSRRFT